ncbi:beta-galactosidase [Microbacterium sp. EYE_5]|uniref:beta-galactosidase n=1 Tax=unclassified Microbacterium TaxID=2609290 RepID=UPI0020036A32|nr:MULTISPECIES: beta-galactosidase [unclassified Microbacterium]MCK6079952.1 beta-galactosidase [Microbacterium sp. EYE_382]MCK6085223.1 beta-galactosidase [Microbacterium sp. EYE_384]MCK6122552.1 beta-galactosidase [Microbacterium sp. EYE_80]MCK6125986.1 beta-galactosidase [Microbacterium sp. EYE_79]MCK6140907.1 beta-galactosidase [Microbacterium sp. EYE_39]
MSAPARPFEHDGIAFGCDYNPEQWTPDVWDEDIALMREAGVDLVAINIFGWAHIEPRAGEYDFARLDDIIGRLHTADIRINLGTGTASTPAWLTTAHPEILPVVEDGTRRYPGGRQAWCPSSPRYRAAAVRLVDAVAARYGSHPAVALWHVSNELGCHNALCHCDESAGAFREWLRARYGSVAEVNRAWGTAFWSQTYYEWDEILTPRATLSSRNPGQLLDFHRFSSDALLAHYRAEAEAIRRHSEIPVTTNFMVTAHIENLDYWSWAGDMDVIANDHYLDHRLGDPRSELAFAADLSRGLGGGAPWILMEHSTGAVNWQPLNKAKAAGEMIRNSLTHVARGADGVCFFQWRASVQGSEKFHSAMLPHAGTDSAVWREVVDLGGIVDRIGEVAGSRVETDVALLFSWESWWATQSETRPSQAFGYLDQVHAAYGAIHANGLTADVVAPGADLSGYRFVVVPGLHLMRESDAVVLTDWIAAGGSALVTFSTAIVDENDRVYTGGYSGPLREALGLHIEEFAPVAPDAILSLSDGTTATLWSERSRATTAEVEASFTDGPAEGMPALTRNAWGEGTARYLATVPSRAAYRDLIARLADEAGVAPAAEVDGGAGDLEVVRRRGADASYLFVINHGETDVHVAASGTDLVTGTPVAGRATVPAGAVRIIREEAAA